MQAADRPILPTAVECLNNLTLEYSRAPTPFWALGKTHRKIALQK